MRRLPIPFDNPATYPGHSGVDFGQPRGTVFRASGPGVVTWLGSNARGGNFIWVRYDIGVGVGYHHMDSHEGCPPEGMSIVEGTPLGYVGNSGHSTGPHLHSEVEGHATTDGYWQFFDPTRVVASGSAAGGSEGNDMNAEEWRQFQVLAANVNKLVERVDNINAWISEGGPGVTKAAAKPGTVAARVINLDRQVTGADQFGKLVGPTVADRLVDVQKRLDRP